MWPTVRDVARSACLCLSVCYWALQKRLTNYSTVWDKNLGGTKKVGGRIPYGKRHFGDNLPTHCKYGKYQACGQYSQLYSIGGSGDASFRCQYCSNLLIVVVVVAVVIVLAVVILHSKTQPRLQQRLTALDSAYLKTFTEWKQVRLAVAIELLADSQRTRQHRPEHLTNEQVQNIVRSFMHADAIPPDRKCHSRLTTAHWQASDSPGELPKIVASRVVATGLRCLCATMMEMPRPRRTNSYLAKTRELTIPSAMSCITSKISV